LVDNLDPLEAAFIDNLQTRYFLDRQPIRISPDDLSVAMANSRRFKLIGVTEKFDCFVRSFGQLNDLTIRTPNSRMNISVSEPLFDLHNDEVMHILRPLVHADLQLYNSIRKKIEG
jgi:hypothetical protein